MTSPSPLIGQNDRSSVLEDAEIPSPLAWRKIAHESRSNSSNASHVPNLRNRTAFAGEECHANNRQRTMTQQEDAPQKDYSR
jgi:hypothetical protein